MKKKILLCLMAFVVLACGEQEDQQPRIENDQQEKLKAMELTAQLVSQVTASNNVKQELLTFALDKYGGELTAHFSELLTDESGVRKSSAQGVISGSFADLFIPIAENHNALNGKNRSQSSDLRSSLADYLEDNNMALFGPYFAENHANSNKPITVSFDPLNEEQESNHGYMFVPKASSQGGTANMGGLDAPMSWDDYELIEVDNIDDAYAWENPTLFVIIDDGNSNPKLPSSANNSNSTNRDIDCNALDSDDIVQLYMRKFKLNGNLRSAPWNRNFIDMWVITGDDISFDANNTAIVNENTAKMWRGKQVSKSDGRQGKWLNSGIGALDLNWEANEVNAYMILAYKSGSEGGTVTANVKTMLKSDGTTETTTTLNATILLRDKYESFFQFPYDRCGTLAVFKTDQGLGKHDNLSIFGADKMQFTLEAIVR